MLRKSFFLLLKNKYDRKPFAPEEINKKFELVSAKLCEKSQCLCSTASAVSNKNEKNSVHPKAI